MKRNKIRRKRRVWILLILFFLSFLLLLSTGKRGFIQQIKIRYQRRQLKKEIEALKEEKKQLEEEKERLKNPDTIEKIAREKYGMAKKNEKVYRVVPEEKE